MYSLYRGSRVWDMVPCTSLSRALRVSRIGPAVGGARSSPSSAASGPSSLAVLSLGTALRSREELFPSRLLDS